MTFRNQRSARPCFVAPLSTSIRTTHANAATCAFTPRFQAARPNFPSTPRPSKLTMQTSPSTPAPKLPPKRLVVFSDGSWNTPDGEYLTNIAVLAQAVDYVGPSGVPQLVFYDPGVGTEGTTYDEMTGGAMGVGIDLNIQQLYMFLVMNYTEGDEIYMFGFSRGSYTVRSLAGMMHESGLLYRKNLHLVKKAYKLYRENKNIDSERAQKFRAENGRRVPITCLTCFDTVGALGIPKSLPFPLSLLSNTDKFKFHNTKLGPAVQNAIHIMSIDEDLVTFEPTPMTENEAVPGQLTQVFMSGGHGGIGGGNGDEEVLARNAMRFVVEEMKRRGLGLDVNPNSVPTEYRLDVQPVGPPTKGLFAFIRTTTGHRPRVIKSYDMLHPTVKTMYKTHPTWRPGSLKPFAEQLAE